MGIGRQRSQRFRQWPEPSPPRRRRWYREHLDQPAFICPIGGGFCRPFL